MRDHSSFALKIQQVSQYSRDPKLRRRAALFLKALELGSIAQACREFDTSPQLYHYWWRRFQKSGFQKEALQEKSRRPKNSPRKIPEHVARWIGRYSKAGHKAEKIRLLLEKDKKTLVSLPTVYRVLSREGFVRRRKIDRASRPMGEILRDAEGRKLPRKIGGRYRVIRAVGSGGGGTVYRVEDLKTEGANLALKLLEIRKETDLSLIDHLKNEFVALTSLKHPHLAKVHDFEMTPKEIFFTSDFIEGKDLQSAAQDADLNLIFQWIVQILSALDFLHRKGIVHRDLKPNNIMVTDPDEAGEVSVKLIDFGSADCRKAGQTAPDELMGTPPYVAPEILMEKPPSPASDLYSVGMILHQIFFKAFPFEEKDPLLMMKEQIYEKPRRLKDLPPALPEEFGDFLLKMVARDPSHRFPSARDVLSEINRILGENFSLRSPKAPLRILEESDFLFRPHAAEEILGLLSEPRPQLIILGGAEGSGKSRIFDRVKERLQIQGIFPFVFREAATLLEFLDSDPKTPKAPILVDGEIEPKNLTEILEALDEKKVKALITTRHPKSVDFFAHHWRELAPLSPQDILDFFQKEISGFPFSISDHPFLALSEGNPKKLEAVLQALAEEGVLQWTDLGWQWQNEVDVNFNKLLPSQAARWEERKTRVLEILKLSTVGFSAETLGGILNLPVGSLEEKLSQWASEGIFKSRTVKKIPHYFLKEISSVTKETSLFKNWEKLGKELETLYAQGNFEAGVGWANLILSEDAKRERIPEKILLLSARLYAAAGQAAKVLSVLPSTPSDAMDPGLFWEVKARAQLALGQLEEVVSHLEHSEAAYEKQRDLSGLSRVFNLWGLLFKRQGEFLKADGSFKKAIRRADEGHDIYLQGLAEMNLALFHQERGEYQRAVPAYEEALRSAAQADHPLLTARLKQNWLNLLFSMGRAAEAEKTAYELLRLSLKHHYKELQSSALNFLALLAGQRNHKELQLNFLNQALSLLKSQELWFPYTQSLINRAFFFWEQNRFTPAELDAEYALSLARRQKNPLFTAWSQLLLGRILRDRPRPDLAQAEELLARAEQGIGKIKNQPLYWEVAFDRGLLAKKKGEIDQARQFFESAQGHLQELLLQVPDFVRQSYLRDRKGEKIAAEIASLEIG